MSDLISRADAIEAVRGLSALVDDEDFPYFEDALNALPSADRPTEDYSDLPDIPRAYYEKIVGNMSHEINMLKQQLEDRPMVHSERPAEWIDKMNDLMGWVCSKCGYLILEEELEFHNYCPSCGAYMKGGNK